MEDTAKDTVTLIVCAYNEEDVIDVFYDRLVGVIDQLPLRFIILFVNDGSTDSTVEKIAALQARDRRVALLDLSRNFGKETAMTAGIDHVFDRRYSVHHVRSLTETAAPRAIDAPGRAVFLRATASF